MIKTMVAYNKQGEKVAMYGLTGKETITDIYKYMTVAQYNETEYVQELRWKVKGDTSKGFANTKKYYLKEMN